MRFSSPWPRTRVQVHGPTVAWVASESRALMTVLPLLTQPDSSSHSRHLPRRLSPLRSFSFFSPSALAMPLSSPSAPSLPSLHLAVSPVSCLPTSRLPASCAPVLFSSLSLAPLHSRCNSTLPPPRLGLTSLALTAAPFASLPHSHHTPLPTCRTSRSGFWGGLPTPINCFIGCGVLLSRCFMRWLVLHNLLLSTNISGSSHATVSRFSVIHIPCPFEGSFSGLVEFKCLTPFIGLRHQGRTRTLVTWSSPFKGKGESYECTNARPHCHYRARSQRGWRGSQRRAV